MLFLPTLSMYYHSNASRKKPVIPVLGFPPKYQFCYSCFVSLNNIADLYSWRRRRCLFSITERQRCFGRLLRPIHKKTSMGKIWAKSSRGGLVRKGVSFSFSKFCTFCKRWIKSCLSMVY